jgi:putative heme-binding domain-containing protein
MPKTQKVTRYATLFRLTALAAAIALAGCSQDESAVAPGAVDVDLPAKDTSVQERTGQPVKAIAMTDAEMAARAKRISSQVSLDLADGVDMHLWASEDLMADPVALSMDNKGRAWVAITRRSNNSEFDIRPYPHWLTDSIAMETNEDRREFLHKTFAADKNLTEKDVPDRNEDGVHDWQDLAVVKEQVLQVSDTTGDGRADRAQTFLEDFNSEITDVLGGIYYDDHTDDLFLAVAPNAWRVKDTDNDGVVDEKLAISDGFGVHVGFSGHGMSGITKGPDGRIYYGIGDIGSHITDVDGNEYPYPNQGVVVRSDPDGSNFEVFAHGVRNTHEFTFDKYGNLISVDNDGDHPGESERVVYLVDGSDSGWRINWQFGKYTDPKNNTYKVWMDEEFYKPRFAGQAAHILPPIAAYHAGPTGMLYNPGTALSERWVDHFFIVQYTGSAPRSGINAFTLEPDGAGFELATDESVMRGVQSTGLDVGPEGALYTSDWIEGWGRNGKGRIWKLDTPETKGSEARTDTAKWLTSDFSQLELATLTKLLGHADMRVRSNAQFELVDRNQRATLTAALDSDEQLARIHAIWGLGQIARESVDAAEPLLALLDDADPEIRAQAAKVIGDAAYQPALQALLANLQHDNARVRFFAAQALGRLGNSDATAPIVAMLKANNDKDVYLRQGGAIALARIGDVEALAALADEPSEAVRVAAVVALRQLKSPALADFLNDDSQFVVTNAARAINDDLFVDDALPALAKLLGTTKFSNEPLLRRVINANAFVADAPAAKRLADYAADTKAPAAMRAEAVAALANWAEPSVFDRVSGRYRGERTGNGDDAKAALADVYPKLLKDADANVREASVNALGALVYADAATRLNDILSDDDSADVRNTALVNLQKLDYADIQKAIYQALEDDAVKVRMTALGMVPTLDIPVSTQVDMHTILLAQGSVTEQQAALKSLAQIKAPEAEAVLADQMQKLIAGDIAPAVKLELINAAENSGKDSLKQLVKEYEAGKDRDDPMQVYAESLAGGDAEEGRNIFRYSSTAQCVRCHVVGTRGNRVGPELTHIGQQLSDEQLLQAMVDPGGRIAPGFGRISVTLTDGTNVEGLFAAESDSELTIETNDGKSVKVARADIAKQTNSPSGMPPMGLLLDKAQLRDLVAFLSNLDGAEAPEGH